jgi:hypothetical protein
MALVPGDDPGLGAQLPEEGGVAGVVRAGEDDAAQVLVAEAAVDLGREVRALEAEQEELRDLALQRETAGEVGDAAGDVGAARSRRLTFARRDDLG